MNLTDKYNMLVMEFSKLGSRVFGAKDFGMEDDEFSAIVKRIESDGLFEKGIWFLGGGYHFNGLTFNGRCFLENNDKKEYSKSEKSEAIHLSVNVAGNNSGNIIVGNGNTVLSEFDKKFNELIEAINSSDIQDKEAVIQELNSNKNNEVSLKKYLGYILIKGAEISSIISAVAALLSL